MEDWWSGQGNHPSSPSPFPLCFGKPKPNPHRLEVGLLSSFQAEGEDSPVNRLTKRSNVAQSLAFADWE